jgi:uncharacterized protein (TIGR00375 family)
MKFIGDFHIHSHYSIATSKDLVPEFLDLWAKIKGIHVVGTGDFTHPGWSRELKDKLEPAEYGLYRLKTRYQIDKEGITQPIGGIDPRFLLTAELSNIYKKGEKVRKVHNLIFAPDFEVVEKIQNRISKIGNITSDGRPILGLDSRDLLEIVLESSEKALFVPSHIWTPWFSALGAKSGFDTIEECYADLAEHIHAVETGLSSDPPMNWMCSFLDGYTLISNSDAHSPEKLGREANLFQTELSYDAIVEALTTGNPEKFLGTVEFFPQEGKYHYDGHRKCGVCWSPLETLRHREICPICGKRVTVGVMNRVMQLADRNFLEGKKETLPYHSLIPLREILSEITGTNPVSKKVTQLYYSLLQKTKTEFNMLLFMTIEEIGSIGGETLAEAVKRMRNGEVYVKEGYDGEYGQIRVFQDDEIQSLSMFSEATQKGRPHSQRKRVINFDVQEFLSIKDTLGKAESNEGAAGPKVKRLSIVGGLNEEQLRAAEHLSGPALVLAGPGTGKTRTLTQRIAFLVENRSIQPQNILAVTFTNKAAEEMRLRLKNLIHDDSVLASLRISTFHAFGLSVLRKYSEMFGRTDIFTILDEDEKQRIIHKELGYTRGELKVVSERFSHIKQCLAFQSPGGENGCSGDFLKYEGLLKQKNVFDLDDLLYMPVKAWTHNASALQYYRHRCQWILVDEYQDINVIQYRMIRLLMPAEDSNLFVIGDPDQAIYGFRGADVQFINRFIDDYPGAEIYKLKQSYRCSNNILRVSNQVLQEGHAGAGSLLQGLQEGVKIKIVENSSDRSEAEFVARTIEEMSGGLRFFSIDSGITEGSHNNEIESLSDFAVLCRLHAQIPVLEKAFNDHSIPYQRVGENSFFRHEPVKPIIDLLKLSVNQNCTYLQNRLAQSISPEVLKKLVSGKTVKQKIVAIIDHFPDLRKEENEESLRKLLEFSHDFSTDLVGFLNFTALGTGVDTFRTGIEAATLMTLHAAKGLEFKCVFIVGCENGLLPYSLFDKQKSDIHEERRLLYVGMTRAIQYLFLTHAQKRFLLGRELRMKKSSFLQSMEEELVDLSKTEYRKRKKKEDVQPDLFST